MRDEPGDDDVGPVGVRPAAVRLVNLTPHRITVRGVSVPPSGTICRVLPGRPCGLAPGAAELAPGVVVHLTAEEVGCSVVGLPPPVEGVLYLVARPAAAVIRRPDVFCPGEMRRDEKGQPVEALDLLRFLDEDEE